MEKQTSNRSFILSLIFTNLIFFVSMEVLFLLGNYLTDQGTFELNYFGFLYQYIIYAFIIVYAMVFTKKNFNDIVTPPIVFAIAYLLSWYLQNIIYPLVDGRRYDSHFMSYFWGIIYAGVHFLIAFGLFYAFSDFRIKKIQAAEKAQQEMLERQAIQEESETQINMVEDAIKSKLQN